MIEITPAIVGPGIEEEYADALAAIDAMSAALGQQELTNDTPEGRVLLNAMWVEQEIEAQRLPIPVDESYVRTIYYLVGSNELAAYPGFQVALGKLWLVLRGYGLIKPRHVPLLISMMDDYLADATPCATDPGDAALLARIRADAKRLRAGGALPEKRMSGPPAGDPSYFGKSSDALDACVPRGYYRLQDISASMFDAWRPLPARKPPLPAPRAGLPPQAAFLPGDDTPG